MWMLYQTVVVKRELSRLIYVPTLTNGHELWVEIRKNQMCFLPGVVGLSLRDQAKSSDIQRELGVELLRDSISHLVREHLGFLQEKVGDGAGERDVWTTFHRLLPLRPGSG